MITKLRLSVLVILVSISLGAVQAQRILHKANKQYYLKHYHEAIESYKKTLKKYPDNLEARSNLAECYRMTNQLVLAEEAYSNIMPEEFLDPIHIRNYGITLMKMAKYNEAHYQFELYKVYNPQDAQHYQLSCEFAHHLYRTENTFDIELVDVNTSNSDFGVAFLNDQLVFSSFRSDIELSDDARKSGQQLNGNMLYIADIDDDLRANNVRFLRSGIAEKKNIGPISFAPNAGICAFTRNKIQDGGAHVTGDDSYHSIYIADLNDDGTWSNERPFRYNEFGTSTGFPCLAFDGSALYFSSNRVGGYGGYDIYVSYWKDDAWTYPENLGDDINTPGNEITPFFNDEDLYFASDYHHGMGGYDIFHSLVKGGKWTHPENMANGINSPADDYYPVIKKDTEGIFFSSNRLGGRGMDDIYLGIRKENIDVFASVDAVPEAVSLSTMNHEIEEAISSNSLARAVANEEKVEVKVLNPMYTEPEVSAKNNTDKVDKEELPMWGFAEEPKGPPSETRQVFVVEEITSIMEFPIVSTLEKENVVDGLPPILITFSNGPTLLEQLISTMDEEELQEEGILEVASNETTSDAPVNEEATVTTKENAFKVEIEQPTMAHTEEAPDSYKIPNYKAISAKKAPLNLDLAGAKRVALGEILPESSVYFIQLAALSKSSGNVNKFKTLSRYGNLYKVFNTSVTKIKLGYFLDKSEASSVLKSVKANGYKDAFITKDDLGSIQLELIVANDSQNDAYDSYDAPGNRKSQSKTYTDEYTLQNPGRNSYKIRLASYEDPIWFDIDKAKQLGKIEQWTKGDWTIFILGGYDSYEAAQQARIKAINKGFGDAEIVIDNNGILQRLKQN